ncbi:hypothetical protein QQ054_10870 [Oscillatoria amoena NRMC-F 0135]|nr:hypothetical protein [Oscillatoria laete-virens]MDL5046535.1 hypothetical protein [Oscillatoria amoena NRMC-F 0135]MDL5054850.1 hypothetical protein [Oscillatoria laete-virens NRMC-F 0139]
MNLLFLANVVWPALFLSMRMAAWWCVLASVLIEAAALWRFAKVRPVIALPAAALMNLVSAFMGMLLIPILGFRWELFADATYNAWLGWGTFNLITYIATWIGVTILTTLIEGFVLWLIFGMPLKRLWIVVLLLANSVTVALAGLTVMIPVPQ